MRDGQKADRRDGLKLGRCAPPLTAARQECRPPRPRPTGDHRSSRAPPSRPADARIRSWRDAGRRGSEYGPGRAAERAPRPVRSVRQDSPVQAARVRHCCVSRSARMHEFDSKPHTQADGWKPEAVPTAPLTATVISNIRRESATELSTIQPSRMPRSMTDSGSRRGGTISATGRPRSVMTTVSPAAADGHIH